MSKQRTGYATTVPNFLDVIGILIALNEGWNPVDENLLLVNLNKRHAAAKSVMDNLDVAIEFDKIKTSEREAAYAPLNPIVQRVLAAAKSCKMDVATIDDIETYKSLIDGNNVIQLEAKKEAKIKREEKKAFKLTGVKLERVAATEEEDKRSVSQQAYDLRYDNFKRLITLLTTAGTYKTNVQDLTLDALNAFLGRLEAANKATNAADVAWKSACNARDAALCAETDSICSTVKDIKAELISMEGSQGVNYKKVTAIKFMKTKD
jgi:hypothetical protein